MPEASEKLMGFNMKKLGIIANVNKEIIGGQSTKTFELMQFLDDEHIEYEIFDVSSSRSILALLRLYKCDELVIILATPGYLKSAFILLTLGKILHKKTHELVIGGIRYKYLINRPILRKLLCNKLHRIYVESSYLVEKYKEIGICNCEYMPNYKCLIKVEPKVISEGDTIKICTFSRINKYKGIDDAVEAISNLETKCDVILDIYGPIDETYKNEFQRIVQAMPSNCHYCGIHEGYDHVELLSNYHILLLPSKWEGEGMAGTILDALAAGLLVIAYYNENFIDVIVPYVNGFLLSDKRPYAIVENIQLVIQNYNLFNEMRMNAYKMFDNFLPRNALKPLLDRLEVL